MALAAALVGQAETVACEATVEHHVTLDGNAYSVVHMGINAASAAAAQNVYIANAPGVVASDAVGSKFMLKSGYAIDVPTDWRKLYFITAAGAPLLSFLPKRGKTS